MLTKPILLITFVCLSIYSLAQPELPYKIGKKTTGKETVMKEIATPIAPAETMDAQSMASGSANEIAETIGALNVSPSGGASYNIPIALPPGINGVAPTLALTYNSQGGNGLAGWGWNVAGVSVISRVAATLFHDGRVGKVNLTTGDAGDRFALDGQRLMLKTGTYGADASVYETEQYSNLKITASGTSPFGAAYGPAYFTVNYPDGSFAVFGYDAGSRSHTEWVITYWQDARGLRISYEYTMADNSLSISKIKYGAAATATPVNEVQFVYGTRNRTEQAYIGGVSFMRKNLLKEIKVLGSGGAGYRSYIINHNTSSHGYNRLISVQEKSGDGSQLHAPVNFSYNTTTSSISHAPSSYTYMQNVEQRNAEMVPLDYNGDGKMEFIAYPTTGTDAKRKFWFLKDFQQQGSYSYPIEYGPLPTSFQAMFPTDMLYSNEKKQPGQGITLVNHSGTSDVQFDVYGEAPASSGAPIARQYQKVWNAPTFYNQYNCTGGGSRYRVPLQYVSGDFNGDGLTDILAISAPYTYTACTPLPGEGCPPVEVEIALEPATDDESAEMQAVDSSLNHLASVDTSAANLVLPPPPECCECATQNIIGSSFYLINLDRRLTSNFANYAGFLAGGLFSPSKLLTADADGDGKTDLFWIKEGSIAVYGLNQNGYFDQLSYISDSRIKLQYPPLIGDYNGDGKSDIMIPTADNSTLFAVFLSTGTGFSKTENTYPFTYRPDQTGIITYAYDLIAVDVDGDSRTDIVDYRTTTYDNSDNGTQTLVPYYNTAPTATDGRPAFTAGTSVTRTGNLRHFPIPVFLPSDKPNTNLEFASASHQWVTYFQFQRDHREEALLRTVTQNGVQETIDYRALEDGATHPTEGITVYERGWDQVFPYVDVVTARSFQVVQGVTRTVNGTVNDKQFFSYKGAVLHQQGLGFLGFEGSAQSNRHTEFNNRVFSVTLSNPQLRGAPVQQHTLLYYPDFYTGTPSYITKTANTYESELLANKVFKLRNTQTVEQNTLENTSVTRTAQYDVYNNPTTVTTNYSGQGTNTINLTYTHSTGTPYYIGRPATKTTTRTVTGQAAFTTAEEWSYNSAGLVSQRRYKGNGIANFDKEDFTYDSYGNLLTKTVTPYGIATGRTESLLYDPTHRFATTTTDVESLSSTYTYNAVTGRLLSQTNPYNQTSSFAYDAWGRLVTSTDIYGKQTTTTYTKNATTYNYTVSASAQNGAEAEQEYDPLKRLIRESHKNTLGAWVHVKQEYDALGRPWRKSEPYTGAAPTQWTTTQYDQYSRPTSITLPTGRVTAITYSGLSVTASDGTKTTTTTKNALGLVTSQQDPGGTINYTYYSNGAMQTTDYGGSVQSIEQDGWGRKTQLTDPSAGVYTYQYNAWSELTKEITPKGSTEYLYDALGKLTQKKVLGDASTGTPATNMVTDYTYDAATKLLTQIALTNADGNNTTHAYTYDSYKRPQQTTEENPQARFTKNYGYDDFGRVSTETFTALNKANSKTATQNLIYTYQNGELKKIMTEEAGAIWELTALNARNQPTAALLGSTGLEQQKTYDAYGLPAEQKIIKSGTELFKHNYTWNAQRALLTSRSTTLFTNSGSPLAENFVFDDLDRLTQWSNPANGTTLTQSYDTRGRIETNAAAGTYVYASTTTYKQQEITLNTAGETAFSGRSVQQAVYNNFKQPVEVVEPGRDKITFQYNVAGQRSHMQWGRTPSGSSWSAARYNEHYSADGRMEITEDAQTGSTTFVIYIGGDTYSAPAIWRSVQGSSTTNEMLYLHRDYLGSIIAITDGNGVVKEKRHFDAWGNIAKLQDGSGATLSSFIYLNRGYTGHEHLSSVGLIHMNGRLYDPTLHRFLMPDNYVQDPSNTQNFNRYAYVLNNPLSYIDPSGEGAQSLDEIVNTLWNSPNGNGGSWNATTGYDYFDSSDEAFGWGVSYMTTFNAWGDNGWPGSPGEAMENYYRNMGHAPGGPITPAMAQGYYQQQWAGIYYNVSASYSPNGQGFNISASMGPVGTMDNALVTYTSFEKMKQLMSSSDNRKFEWEWGFDMALGAAEANAGNVIKNRYVISWPGYGPQPVQGPVTVKTPIGTTFDVSRKTLGRVANGLKYSGWALGAAGIGGTLYEIGTGKKGLIGEGGLDLVMGGVGFIPGGGWIVSGAYFGGKALLEWADWDFWND